MGSLPLLKSEGTKGAPRDGMLIDGGKTGGPRQGLLKDGVREMEWSKAYDRTLRNGDQEMGVKTGIVKLEMAGAREIARVVKRLGAKRWHGSSKDGRSRNEGQVHNLNHSLTRCI